MYNFNKFLQATEAQLDFLTSGPAKEWPLYFEPDNLLRKSFTASFIQAQASESISCLFGHYLGVQQPTLYNNGGRLNLRVEAMRRTERILLAQCTVD